RAPSAVSVVPPTSKPGVTDGSKYCSAEKIKNSSSNRPVVKKGIFTSLSQSGIRWAGRAAAASSSGSAKRVWGVIKVTQRFRNGTRVPGPSSSEPAGAAQPVDEGRARRLGECGFRLSRRPHFKRKPMAAKSFPVEASHILMFARSIGDENPVYTDAEAAKKTEAGGIIAPPTFAQASAQFDPDYFLRPKAGQPWFGSGKNPTGIVRTEGGGGRGGGG